VDRVVGLESVRAEFAMVETPDGHGQLELTKFHAPSGRGGDRHAPANKAPAGWQPPLQRQWSFREGIPCGTAAGALVERPPPFPF
jgi:hypothetical protein